VVVTVHLQQQQQHQQQPGQQHTDALGHMCPKKAMWHKGTQVLLCLQISKIFFKFEKNSDTAKNFAILRRPGTTLHQDSRLNMISKTIDNKFGTL
jgi:hypothetical protein